MPQNGGVKMGQTARSALSQLAPVLWTAAAILFLIDLFIKNDLIDLVVVLSTMAAAGTIASALEALYANHERRLLIRTIERLTRPDGERPPLRRVK
jgi:hypothetical protein